jgi:hypothetical protein
LTSRPSRVRLTKMNILDDMDDNEEFYPNTSLVSTCCGALPWSEVDEHMCGICSKCKEHAVFETDSEE